MRAGEHAGRVELATADGTVLVELRERTGARPVPPGGRLGLYHYAILLPDRGALGRFVRHLTEQGIRAGASDHRVSEALYLHDPDGLGIEVYADRPQSRWRQRNGELVMATEPLDLDALVAAAGARPWTGMPAGTRMGHVHLHVGDVAGASAFYHDALGFDRMVWSYPGALFMAAGGYHHHLGVNTWAAHQTAASDDDACLLEWRINLPGAADVAGLPPAWRRPGTHSTLKVTPASSLRTRGTSGFGSAVVRDLFPTPADQPDVARRDRSGRAESRYARGSNAVAQRGYHTMHLATSSAVAGPTKCPERIP
jgi:catechol-2,3-dioxygenase